MGLDEITTMINKADEVYLALANELGGDHPDAMYMKGHRDGYLKIYNLLKTKKLKT
jgi:hypothetical protein